MSRTTQPSALRPLAGAALLAAAAMAAPMTSHAQTSARTSSEAALLNRLAPTVYVPNAFALGWGSASPAPADAVNGERALLAPTPIVNERVPAAVPTTAVPVSVNGAYALLGRLNPVDARRRIIPASSR